MATILDLQVGAETDDCVVHWNGAAWVFDLASAAIRVGYASATILKIGSGMRFLNVTIPNNATIITAYLTPTAKNDDAHIVVNSIIHGEDADNAVTFDDYADYAGRDRTAASVNWNAIDAWTAETEYDSPEIKTIIQEIVDRGSWASGNAMVIFWDDHDDNTDHDDDHTRRGYGHALSDTKCAKLHIEYTVPAVGRSFGFIIG